MSNWIAVALAMASGGLFALALPPFDFEWLGWVALAPLIVAVSVPGRRTLHAVGLGLLAGIVAGAVQIGYTPGAKSLGFAYLPFIWIGLVFGLVSGLISLIRKRFPDAYPLFHTLFVACVGVAVEWLTTLSPLPVGVALCQWRNTVLIQIAAFTGIWGVSFLLWLCSGALADLALRCKPFTAPVALVGLLVVLAYGSGLFQTGRARTDYPRPSEYLPVTVAAVQDYNGIDGDNSDGSNGTRDGGGDMPDIETLMRQATGKKAELIIGSEEALGSGFIPNELGDSISLLAQEKKVHLVVGYV